MTATRKPAGRSLADFQTIDQPLKPADGLACEGNLFQCPGFIALGEVRLLGAQIGGENKGAMNRAPTVGEIIRAFKARCTHGINQLRKTQGASIWQRNYYEHIIRSESSLQETREYIVNNPAQWANDRENPDAVGARFIAPNYDDAKNQGAIALHSHSTNPSKAMGKWLVNRAPTGSKGIKV